MDFGAPIFNQTKIEITTTAEGHIVSKMNNLPLYMGIHHQQNIGMCSLGGMISKHAWNIISFYNMIHVFFLVRFYISLPWSICSPQVEDVRRKQKQHFSKDPLTNHGLDFLIRLIAFQIPRTCRWISLDPITSSGKHAGGTCTKGLRQ